MHKYLAHEPLKKTCTHSHEHSHEHVHADARTMDKKILKISFSMTFLMMLAQFIYSILSNSLALLSDTLHMFWDVFALALSFLAIVAAQKWQDSQKTFGYFRLEILVSFINALTIILSALFIIYEAIQAFISPKEIDVKIMIIIAVLGFFVNGIAALIMFKGANLENVNMKSAFLHVLSDLLGSLAVIIGGVVMYFSNIVYIDALLALVLSILLLRWAFILLKQSTNVLLESSPVDVLKVKQALLLNPYVDEVVDLHIIQITNQMLIAFMHIKVSSKNLKEFEKLSQDLSHKLLHDFQIGHTTIQPIRSENET